MMVVLYRACYAIPQQMWKQAAAGILVVYCIFVGGNIKRSTSKKFDRPSDYHIICSAGVHEKSIRNSFHLLLSVLDI